MTNRAEVLSSLSWQRHQPPLLYLMGALLIRWIDRSDVMSYLRINPLAVQGDVSLNNLNSHLHSYALPTGNTLAAVSVMRLLCLLLASSTLWFIYEMGYLVSGKPIIGLLAMILVATMPTFVFIAGSINNDNLVTFIHTAGVYWLLSRWQARCIQVRHALLIGLIAGGLALSKYQGLPLIMLIGVVLLAGAWVRRWTWREALLSLGGLALGLLLLAGWWYARNLSIYGDLMAVSMTRSIWGRGPVTTDLGVRLVEFIGVWRSMWYMLGYLNIAGPTWFYPWVTLVSGLGLLSGVWLFVRKRHWFTALLLSSVIVMLWVTLYISTSQINASQGRFLFPSLIAFAPLVAAGLHTIAGKRSIVLLLPLIVVTLLTPVDLLRAYRPLEVVTSLPNDTVAVERKAEGIHLLGYRLQSSTVPPDGILALDVFLQGNHPDDPALIVAALDPVSGLSLGQAEFFPGMAALSTLEPNKVYRARTLLQLQSPGGAPQQAELLFQWRVIDPSTTTQGRFVNWDNGDTALVSQGPLIQDAAFEIHPPNSSVDVNFGDAIQLFGYTGPESRVVRPDDAFELQLFWRSLRVQADDLRLAFGLLNDADQILVQADGYPQGLPSRSWQADLRFVDTRRLVIPSDAPPGTYRLYLAWYRSEDNSRLSINNSDSNLFLDLPKIEIVP